MAVMHPGSGVGPIRWGASFFNLNNFGADLWTVLGGRHGLWSATPIAAIACVGLAYAVTTDMRQRGDPADAATPQIALPAAIVTLAMVVLMATVRDPDGGHAFGARRLAGLTPILAFGMLRFIERAAGSRRAPRRFLEITIWALIVFNLVRTAAAINGGLSLSP
jgi:hypothetical protein